MGFKWTDNELDDQLFAEFAKDQPNEQRVRELVERGANINAVDKSGQTVLSYAVMSIHDGLDIAFIQLIIDLGADPNIDVCEGFNCLYDAALTHKPELIELLLKAGANPNCISTETPESILDWAEFEVAYIEYDGSDGGEAMKQIVQLLKDYGAKSIDEISAEEPEKL